MFEIDVHDKNMILIVMIFVKNVILYGTCNVMLFNSRIFSRKNYKEVHFIFKFIIIDSFLFYNKLGNTLGG